MVRGGTWWLIPISGVPSHRNVAADDLAACSPSRASARRTGLSLPHRVERRRGAARIYPSRVTGDPLRYFATGVLRSADAQTSATARLGSACPGNVAHPVFITNSVCSQDDVMAVSSPSFLARATSAFSPARQIGSNAAVTAASACFIVTWSAVLLVVQPPQLNPTIMVRTLPTTTPQTPGFSHARCTCMIRLLA